MTTPNARVIVTCESCELGLALGTSPLARLRAELSAFFTEHDGCETRIDLSKAPGLRLLPVAAQSEHCYS